MRASCQKPKGGFLKVDAGSWQRSSLGCFKHHDIRQLLYTVTPPSGDGEELEESEQRSKTLSHQSLLFDAAAHSGGAISRGDNQLRGGGEVSVKSKHHVAQFTSLRAPVTPTVNDNAETSGAVYQMRRAEKYSSMEPEIGNADYG